jgi:hypothetical protein
LVEGWRAVLGEFRDNLEPVRWLPDVDVDAGSAELRDHPPLIKGQVAAFGFQFREKAPAVTPDVQVWIPWLAAPRIVGVVRMPMIQARELEDLRLEGFL